MSRGFALAAFGSQGDAGGKQELLAILWVVWGARLGREKGNSKCRWVLRLSECREEHWISLLILINEYAKLGRMVFPTTAPFLCENLSDSDVTLHRATS